MLVDTHCHIDMFDDPVAVAQTYDRAQVGCVMTTMLPSHFALSLPYLKPFRTIRPALGMHPLRSAEGQSEIQRFNDLVRSAEYIGEIGMDLGPEGRKTRETQSAILQSILPMIGAGKFVSVHSRNANEEVCFLLDEHGIDPVCFHYFTGGVKAAEQLVAKGHYFSVNHRMLRSNKHRRIVGVVPRDRVLVESDGPFLTKRPLAMIENACAELGEIWRTCRAETEDILARNFSRCRTAAPHREGRSP